SNVENIVKHFTNHPTIKVTTILCNNPNAGVIDRAKRLDIPCIVFSKKELEDGTVGKLLQQNSIDFIVLAGFLLKFPENLTMKYTHKIINIHPALLPKYGGKGMFGDNVHKAVVENEETESGITIHFVNQHYDEGKIIFQTKCEVLPTDTFEDVASKIHALEYEYFPKVISDLLLTLS
ncbi:MAG: phosphoribosylglycinamide formyltransferase, partial [Bdellovibrionales bacterium]|nr:phosphoribosylglycinamide formyltransferase [Bdellovibrionales bacterium]